MSILDAIILVPILFGAYKGFQKGLVMELVTIIAFLLATIASFKLLYVGVALLEPYLGKNESVLPVVSFVIIFVLVIYLVTLLGKEYFRRRINRKLCYFSLFCKLWS